MATYNDRINYTIKSDAFRQQVAYALIKKAFAIKTAPDPTPAPADWQQQKAWAERLLSGGDLWRWVDRAVTIVAANEQINVTATAADTDVQWQVEQYAVPMLQTMGS